MSILVYICWCAAASLYHVSVIPAIGRYGNYVLFLWQDNIIDLIIYAGYEQAHL